MSENYMIKKLSSKDLESALSLVWDVFCEFEVPDYSKEGILEFKKFIEFESVKLKIINSEMIMWGYFNGENIIGVLAARSPCHICLLFVDKHYHRQGIARTLLNEMIGYYKINSNFLEITVNSSLYAAEAYHRLGFIDTDKEQTINGIRFIPMKHVL